MKNNNDFKTQLHFAALNGHIGYISKLIESESNLYEKNNDFNTPFLFADMNSHIECF